ncbi:hypothetical protein BDV95DRAFT_251293 [Massariosphaeria phaeospora]|uniref:Uncharacterized protein n=1 Tax=Massariosphaeria phaeospora TaxID=100035 RepID=A0A7C8M1V8_9PLEO|nr:hypothetical protein BDV95DRAFT_251293 [Massariosphaeria phaeospora]
MAPQTNGGYIWAYSLFEVFCLGTFIYLFSMTLPTSPPSRWASLIPALFLLGDDVLHKALAVAAPDLASPLLPMSTGWLKYMLSALQAVVSGTRDLLPEPEIDATLINMRSGHGRRNHSWLLSRLIGDMEKSYEHVVGGLSVTILDATAVGVAMPAVWTLWIPVMDVRLEIPRTWPALLLQVIVAYIPCFLYHDPLIVLFTAAGITQASKLPAWLTARFTCRRDDGKRGVYGLTRGNGHRHVFVIRNTATGALNLEDLAARTGEYDWFGANWVEGTTVCVLALGWFGLMMVATTLSQNVGYLIAVMAIGTVSNLLTACLPRTPAEHGIPLTKSSSISGPSVMNVLQDLERQHPGFGLALLSTFFPGGVRPTDAKFWDEARKSSENKGLQTDAYDEDGADKGKSLKDNDKSLADNDKKNPTPVSTTHNTPTPATATTPSLNPSLSLSASPSQTLGQLINVPGLDDSPVHVTLEHGDALQSAVSDTSVLDAKAGFGLAFGSIM